MLHGADSDVEWLQRDFGIYVVNMFDTGQAARVLEMPSFGLVYLLDHYCAVKVNRSSGEYALNVFWPRWLPLAKARIVFVI